MRANLICLLLCACATPPAERDCPALPTLKPGAGRADMINHIRVTADLYAKCGAKP